MSGYIIEIGSPQPLQRARSSSHESTGTFSYHARPLPQRGQCERGLMMDSLGSAPQRRMQTFRKLPISAPNSAPYAIPSGPGCARSITHDLIQKNAGCNWDIERLYSGGKGNPGATHGDSLQSGAHTGAFV